MVFNPTLTNSPMGMTGSQFNSLQQPMTDYAYPANLLGKLIKAYLDKQGKPGALGSANQTAGSSTSSTPPNPNAISSESMQPKPGGTIADYAAQQGYTDPNTQSQYIQANPQSFPQISNQANLDKAQQLFGGDSSGSLSNATLQQYIAANPDTFSGGAPATDTGGGGFGAAATGIADALKGIGGATGGMGGQQQAATPQPPPLIPPNYSGTGTRVSMGPPNTGNPLMSNPVYAALLKMKLGGMGGGMIG